MFPNLKIILTLPNEKKLYEFAGDKIKFVENGGKFSKRILNAASHEIACYMQFLLFQQSFEKTRTADTKKDRFVRERVELHKDCNTPEFSYFLKSQIG